MTSGWSLMSCTSWRMNEVDLRPRPAPLLEAILAASYLRNAKNLSEGLRIQSVFAIAGSSQDAAFARLDLAKCTSDLRKSAKVQVPVARWKLPSLFENRSCVRHVFASRGSHGEPFARFQRRRTLAGPMEGAVPLASIPSVLQAASSAALAF